jgi:uncharacterized protein YjiS (DUF1127 family)
MKMFSLTRFLRARRTYRNVFQELPNYSDRELHDIGIDPPIFPKSLIVFEKPIPG